MLRATLRYGLAASVAALPLALASTSSAIQDEEAQSTLPNDWVNQLRWRDVGPANMSGRITDFAVYEADPTIWWAATASGGLLKTTDNGVTFEHQFDHEATVSLGDVTVAQSDPNIVWVGTGEDNPRNSVSWGNGVYKSTDGGETWTHMGLDESFQIGEIQIHPDNPDIVYVGALGRLWGPNEERGLFKTTDGGETWEKVLYVDDKTGVIDIDMHPADPNTLIASTYERERDGFDGNDPGKKWGEGSGLWKTVDGGANWTQLRYGLPEVTMGRVGLDYSRSNPNNVYAVIETELIAQEPEDAAFFGAEGEDLEVGFRVTELTEEGPAAAAGLETGDVVLSIDGEIVQTDGGDFARKIRGYAAGNAIVVEVARNGSSQEFTVELAMRPEPEEGERGDRGRRGRGGGGLNLSSGLGGQTENLQDQQGPRGFNHGGIYKSTDGGETWFRINSLNPRPMYYSQIRVDPSDDNHIWVLGTSLYRSEDGGETFMDNVHRGENGSTHVDHHAMWIDNSDGRHVILGNDGGIYITHDRSGTWDHLNHVAIGQFYHVAVDNTPDYNVYGGLQDNGSWGGPSVVRNDSGPINTDWFRIGGGDGFIVRIDPADPDQLYVESQNGSTSRLNLRTGERGSTRPGGRGRGGGGERVRYNFNWKTPFILSNHNPKIYYSAGNYVFRSIFKGEDNALISPEITNTDRGAGSALAESPLNHNVLYVGTTDGAVWGSRDFGQTWYEIFVQREESSDEPPQEEDDEVSAADDDVQATNGDDESSSPGAQDPQDQQQQGRRRGRGGFGGGQFIERLRGMDANEDGKIERSEVPERMGGFFDRLDSNGDGAIDEAELNAAAAAGPEGARRARAGAGRQQDGDQPPAVTRDPVSGEWSASIATAEFEADFTMTLQLGDDNVVTGTVDSDMGGGEIENGRWEPENNRLTFDFATNDMSLAYTATIGDDAMEGEVTAEDAGMTLPFEATRAPARNDAAEQTEGSSAASGAGAASEAAQDAPAANDGVSGVWSARVVTNQFESEFSFVLKLGDDNGLTGTIDTQLGSGDISDGRYDPENNRVTFVFASDEMTLEYTGTIDGNRMEGDIAAAGAGMTFPFEATRSMPEGAQEARGEEEERPVRAARGGGEQGRGEQGQGRGRRQRQAPPGDPLADLVPGPRWVSSIEASHHESSRVYLTLDGHRSNDDEPYVFVSEDYGESWRSIRSNLPTSAGSTRVMREDIANPNVLYLGCEFSCWVSVDRGESWTKLNSNLPTVAVHEIAQHPTSNEIIAGTHGRSVWICDITPIRQMSPETVNADVHLYEPNDVIRWRSTARRGDSGLRQYVGENPDEDVEIYYSLASNVDNVTLKVTDLEGNVIRTLEPSGEAGFHMIEWDGRRDPPPGAENQQGRFRFRGRGGGVDEGEYKVVLTAGGDTLTQKFSIIRDPATPADAVSTEGLWEWIEAMGDDEEGD